MLTGGLTASVPLRARGSSRPSSTGSGRSGCTADNEATPMADVTILPGRGTGHRRGGRDPAPRAGRAGLRYRVGCKRGGCGICKVQLVLGEVRYERPIAESVLSRRRAGEGICLSCRAVPLTNIVIELQEGDRLRRVLGFAYPNSTAHRRAGRGPAGRRGTQREEMSSHERRHPAGICPPAGHRPRGGPQPLLQHARDGGRARGARASCGSSAGTSGTTTPWCWRRAASAWSSSATRSRAPTPWRTSSSGPSSSARPPAGSAPGRTSRSATGCGSPCPRSTPSSSTPTWSSPAPRPGRSTPRRGRGTCAGSARTGSTTR